MEDYSDTTEWTTLGGRLSTQRPTKPGRCMFVICGKILEVAGGKILEGPVAQRCPPSAWQLARGSAVPPPSA